MHMPIVFPTGMDTPITLKGKAGIIETKTTAPESISAETAIAVVCHPHPLHGGAMDNKVVYTLTRAFHQLNLCTVRFNFRGVGKSAGTFDHANGETEDLLQVIAWVKTIYPHNPIWLAGFSFGSFVAARAASSVQPQRLFSIAPAVNNADFLNLAPIHCRWDIIQGDEDEIVPPEQVYTTVKKLPATNIHLHVITGCSHFFHGKLINLRELIIALAQQQ